MSAELLIASDYPCKVVRMEGAEQLLAIAEIGAAFAGFTGVIGALGRG